jgi:putative inorganic carbon (HCO3(-)) transporter
MIRQYARQVTDFELWVLLALSAASLFWFDLLPAVVVTAAFFWLARLAGYGYLSKRTPADWGIALLCLALFTSLVITSVPGKTIPQVWRTLGGIVLYYAIVNWVGTRTRINLLYKGIITAGLGLALLAPLSVEWPVDKLSFLPSTIYQRFFILLQDFIHPNVMGGALVLLLPFPTALLLFGWKKSSWMVRILSSTALVLMLGMLFLTRSRGAWIAATISLFLLLVLWDKRSWLLLLIAGIGVVIGGFLFGFSRLTDAIVYNNTIGGWNQRLEIWSRAVNLINDFPFTGIGMGTFQEMASTFYAYDIYAPGHIPHAHNLIFQISLDVGIPGIIAWLAILLVMIYTAWKVYKRGSRIKENLYLGIGAALLASQTALITHGMMDSVTWGMVRSAPLVWIVWGMVSLIFLVTIKS